MKERRRYTLDNAEDFFAFNYSIKELLSEIYREELQTCVYNAFYQVMMLASYSGFVAISYSTNSCKPCFFASARCSRS